MTAIDQSSKAAKYEEVDREWEFEAQRNYEWIDAHREELLSLYNGQWLAVAEQQLLAHDPDWEVVVRQARERGFAQPLCYFLSSEAIAFA